EVCCDKGLALGTNKEKRVIPDGAKGHLKLSLADTTGAVRLERRDGLPAKRVPIHLHGLVGGEAMQCKHQYIAWLTYLWPKLYLRGTSSDRAYRLRRVVAVPLVGFYCEVARAEGGGNSKGGTAESAALVGLRECTGKGGVRALTLDRQI